MSILGIRITLVALAFGLASSALAQPCSIDLGPDHTICQNATTTLNGPAGFSNYLWSTSAVTPNITVGAPAATYWCEVNYPFVNPVVNGNFSAGNTGFSSQFNLNNNLQGEGTYNVGSNPNAFHPQYSGGGSGNFLIVNAGFGSWSAGQLDCWCQTVTVCPEQTYTLSFRGRSLTNALPARLIWVIDGVMQGPEFTMPAFGGGWGNFSATWSSGVGQTTANICLRVTSANGVGDDFGIDDIIVSGNIVLRDYIDVLVNPLPVMNCGGPYGPLCINSTAIALNGSPAGGTWSGNGVVGSTFTPSSAGLGVHALTYSYTDGNNCPNTCTTNVTINPLPILACGTYGPYCVSANAINLGGFPNGGTWSGPGVVANVFTPASAGVGLHNVTYTYTNANGCTNTCTTNVTVNALPVVACGGPYPPVCIDAVDVPLNGAPLGGTWSGTGVTGNNFDPSVGSQTVTYTFVDANGCSNSCTTNVTVNALPVVACGGPYPPVCIDAVDVPLNGSPLGGTWSGTGGTGNNFDPSVGSQTVTYTFVDANGCSNSCTTNITVNALPVVACGGPYPPVCIDAVDVPLNGSPLGGTWSGTGVTGNNFDPSVGSQTVTYTFVDANGCSNSCTTNITVNALPVVACGGPYPPVCIDAVDVPLNGSPLGGTWSGTGVTGNNFDPSVGSQTVTYTFVDANGCSNSCTTNVTVNALPVVACGGPYSPVCIDAVDVLLNGSPLGGTWSGTGVTGNNFDPSVGSQTVTYTFVDANGCSNSCTTNVTVNALPVVACGGPYPPFCIDAVDVPLNGSPLGGTWSGTGVTGNNFDPSVGSQTVTYTFVDANGCSNSCTTNITVNALPVVACGGPYPPVCIDAVDVPLSGSPLGGTWSGTGVTGNNFDPSVGSQTVTYTFVGANGCSNSCTTNITVNALPVLVPGNYGPYCASDAPINLGGIPMGGTWTGAGVNAGSFNPAVTGAGTYPLTYSYNDVNGCSQSAQTSLTVFPAPVVDIGGDTTVCPGQSVTFNALTPGATYIWQGNSVGPTFSTSTPMIVTVQVTVNGCTTASSAQLINFNLQSVNLGPDVSVCEGTAVPLSVNVSGATYAWSTTSTANAINANTTDWYWVDVSLNGCSVRDSIYVTIKPNPIVNLGLDRMVCPGATALLNATTPNATYLWSNNAITPTVNADLGAWSVQVTVDGCPGTDMVNVGNYVAPTVNLGPDTILCPGASLLLNATTPFMSYSWQNASTAATFLVQQAGSFSVTLIDSHGCTGSDLINVGYASPNQVFIGNDTTICSGTMITLDASTPGATLYSWNNGWNSNTLPVAGGLYWVDVVQGNCMVTDSIHIGVAFPPVFSLGNDTTLCPGATLLLDATVAGVNYLWQDNSTLPTLLVSDDGTFSVTLTNADLCAATETITVTYADPDALDLGPDTSICSGTTLTLQATLPGSTYLWNTLAQTSTIDVTDPGSYSVVVMQGGCSVTDDINVLVAPSPFVDLGNDTTLCDASTLTLDAFYPGATYVWTTNEVTSSLTVSSANTYGVTVDLNGCSATDSIEVAYVGALAIDLGNDTTLCPGALLDLFASLPGGTTVWSTNTVGPTITVSQADTLWANVSVSGCSVSDSIIVQYVQLDQLDLGSDAAVCEADAMDFDITIPGATYLWDDNSTNPVRSIDEEGDYWARITLGGCETSDTVHITITPLPLVYLGPDTGLCAGSTLLLNASQPGATYLWNNSSTQGTITAVPGEWNVEVTLNGCTAGDSITIASLPTPSLSLPTDTTLCTGSVWIIDVAQPNATYVWQDASTASGFLVDAADNYNVTVSIGGCSAYAEVDVSYFDASLVDLGPDTTLCPGQQLLLSLTLPGVVLTWPNGLHGNDFTVSSSGTYTLLANANGCTASDEINVDYTPLGQPELGDDRTLCEGDSVVLVVVPGSASVLWNSGSTSDSLLTTTSGTYSVSLSLDGCSATDAVEFEFVPVIDSIDLGEDATICLGNTVVLDAFVNRATYDWNTGSNTASINVTSPGLYIVQLAGPCISAIDSVLVIEGNCPSEIFIPNSFTPDGDGLNEVFGPITTGNFKSFTFLIFNRWGENIFSSETPGGSWDGTLNGTMVQDGVYVWQLAYRAVTDVGVEQKRLTGSVTLLR